MLFNPPVTNRDHTLQRLRDPPDHAALHLLFDTGRIDHHSAVNRCDDAIDVNSARFEDHDIDDVRQMRVAVVDIAREAAPSSGR